MLCEPVAARPNRSTDYAQVVYSKPSEVSFAYLNYRRDTMVVSMKDATASIEDDLLSSIRELAGDRCEDELPPSELAKKSLLDLMGDAFRLWVGDSEIPMPFVTTRGDGDLSCAWRKKSKELYLSVFPDGQGRLHLFESPSHEVRLAIKLPHPKELVESLNWLINNGPIPRSIV
jgi:hypothetical protein